MKYLFVIFILLVCCSNNEQPELRISVQESGTYTDSRDGQEYDTLKLGNYTWFLSNLNYKVFYTSYYYDSEIFGRLYEYDTTVCPDGWHTARSTEWDDLISTYGVNSLKDADFCLVSDDGTNSTGMSIRAGGIGSNKSVNSVGYVGYYWGVEDGSPMVYSFQCGSDEVVTSSSIDITEIGAYTRCVKDEI